MQVQQISGRDTKPDSLEGKARLAAAAVRHVVLAKRQNSNLQYIVLCSIVSVTAMQPQLCIHICNVYHAFEAARV